MSQRRICGLFLWLSALTLDLRPLPSQDASETLPSNQETLVFSEVHLRFAERAKLSFQRPGVIQSLLVKEGDEVSEGDLVAKLDTEVPQTEYDAARMAAEMDSEHRFAVKKHEAALHEYQLVQRANVAATTPVKPFPIGDELRLKLAAEAADLESVVRADQQKLARQKAAQALAELNAHQLKAPFAGLVCRVYRSEGEAVQPAQETIELVNTSRIIVDTFVDVETSLKLRKGYRAKFRPLNSELLSDSYEGEFAGQIRLVDVSVDEVRQLVRVSVEFENPEGLLREGLRGELRIRLNSGEASDLSSGVLAREPK